MLLQTLKAPAVRASIRAFSTTRPVADDLARAQIIGRLGNDPIKRETQAGKPYYTYSIAASVGLPKLDSEGKIAAPPATSWFTIFCFNEKSHLGLERVGKGSTVFVEAEIEQRAEEGTNRTASLYKHLSMRVINRVAPVGPESTEPEAE